MIKTHKQAEIAKIHIAKAELKLDEDTYRDIIREASAGKTESSAKLDWQGRRDVLERFKQLGWVAKISVKAAQGSGLRAKDLTPSRPRRLADDPQSVMLRALWIQLHQAGKVKDPSEAALASFAKRMTRKDALQWLTDRDVTIVKKALSDWLSRDPEPRAQSPEPSRLKGVTHAP